MNESNKKPYVILSDLNMPKMNGIELLKIIKNDEALRNIPVVVLTTSQAEDDIAESFKLGVDGYMVKSDDYDSFLEIIRAIIEMIKVMINIVIYLPFYDGF